MGELEPVVLALTSDEGYFPGLYCAVASALSALDPARKVDVKVLDGGLSQPSRDTLASLVERIGKRARLDFVKADLSIFDKATLDTLRQDLKFAFRMLYKDRRSGIAAIITLGLCIGANSALFTIVQSVLLRPLSDTPL